ncbi:coiled-coil protein isoform X2 [Wolffia australiana]
MHAASHDLAVNANAKKKQVLLDLLPFLSELRNALDMQVELETLTEEGNYFKAFQVLSEYLQVLDYFSELTAMQEMSRGVESWLSRTLHKLDSLLLGVCQSFNQEAYLTALDAYALIGDTSGLAEKIQSFFMQEVLSKTHSVLRSIVQEELGSGTNTNRLTYSDICMRIPQSKFYECLLSTLDTLFQLMCSYFRIMSFFPEINSSDASPKRIEMERNYTSENPHLASNLTASNSVVPHEECDSLSSTESQMQSLRSPDCIVTSSSSGSDTHKSVDGECNSGIPSSHSYPFYCLRKDSAVFVSQVLERGRKNLWQLSTSRLSVLLSCPAVCSTSIHNFLRNYEDLKVFILAGEAFCAAEAVEFRQKLKTICESYLASFHRQNISALRMVLERETWAKIPSESLQTISLAGLVGDGAPIILPKPDSDTTHSRNNTDQKASGYRKKGFTHWVEIPNPFETKITQNTREHSHDPTSLNKTMAHFHDGDDHFNGKETGVNSRLTQLNVRSVIMDEENEDLFADFIDEDSQLPSRISKPIPMRDRSAGWKDEEISAQTGSSICLLRLMDKYARLMQKLELVNFELFKGICQLFGVFFYFIFETFGQLDTSSSGKAITDSYRLKLSLSKISQDYDMWIKQLSMVSSPSKASYVQMDVAPTVPASTIFGHRPNTSLSLKERCAAVESIALVAGVLGRSKPHLQSLLLQKKTAGIEDFFDNLVGSVSDLTDHVHKTTTRLFLHINGYPDRIANTKWDVKDLGIDHNGYVDLLLGEFKHFKTRLEHGNIKREAQDRLLEHGLENVAEVLVEGLSRVKRCTDEGRALMSLDLQVLINGLQHFTHANVRQKFQIVETFIKAYYLPETEYVYWARSHPEYSKSQIVGLVNLVSSVKNWKRKTRLEVLERIEASS